MGARTAGSISSSTCVRRLLVEGCVIAVPVTAERDGRWWLVRVPEVPAAFTQARRPDQVEAMAREVIALLLDVPEDAFDLRLEPVVPAEIAQDYS